MYPKEILLRSLCIFGLSKELMSIFTEFGGSAMVGFTGKLDVETDSQIIDNL